MADDEVDERTAHHEAGHAVAYLASGLSIRYATIRARGGNHGRVAPPRRRRIGVTDAYVTACAGPVAEGLYLWHAADEDDRAGCEVNDFIMAAWLAGGCGDMQVFDGEREGVWDSWQDTTKTMVVERYWPAVTAIAEALLIHNTLPGRVLRELAEDSGLPLWCMAGLRR
ncbi:MAG TPA: hypothetical protein VGS97_25110 [Actinocrinis sp.]|uniref:hypothetical protein n=1 Tax=Actinocrinis sp. TaxID=1920516 RepID=UPI002DDD2796|nr:hypothetical protein [Actinocrinis sp.]HEV2347399.1 hypothetical protein [Actinocrinis sp.]